MKVDAPTLARHMVESATEFDYDEVPAKVRRKLEDAAAAFIAAMDVEPIVVREGEPRPPKGGAGDSGAARGGLIIEAGAIVINNPSDPNRAPDAVLNRIVRERNVSRYFR